MKKFFIAAAAMLFAACDATPTENLPLENTVWKLVELNGENNEAFAEGDSFTFTLDAGTITGKGSVNRFFGGYEYSEAEGLEVGDLGMTRMMGPNVDLEDAFVQIFDKVNGCEVEGDVLTLTDGDEVLAVFKAWTPDPEAEQAQPVGGLKVISLEEVQQAAADAE
ncbi:MAG: META domain-containing protein [Alistipes sp.]|nr:META domain-containing protein [Alistipes sp.]